MSAYAFWNNKGGVGKSFLCFIASGEYAHRHPESDVYVIDLCPQGNVSETLLGGSKKGSKALDALLREKPRCSVAGYLEARLNSPFQPLRDVAPYFVQACNYNSYMPENLFLVPGDNLLELLSEAIRQTSQLAVPTTAWKQVVSWVEDLSVALREKSGSRDAVFFIDCNPSFSIYTQLALVAAEKVVVPITADDSSRRGIENIVALLYGVGGQEVQAYSKINFSRRAKDEGVSVPKLHAIISNRVTLYEGKASHAFKAAIKPIKQVVADFHDTHRTIFANPQIKPDKLFVEVPDYHSACIVAASTGTPLHELTPGPKDIAGERVQLNKPPLERYQDALEQLVDLL